VEAAATALVGTTVLVTMPLWFHTLEEAYSWLLIQPLFAGLLIWPYGALLWRMSVGRRSARR
jgi:hypothetical protein